MKIMGIDLGTTNSAAAVYDRGQGVMIRNAEATDMRTIPSIVALRPKNAEPVVGKAAEAFGKQYPQFTYVGLKRLIGRAFDDPYVQSMLYQVPYEIVEGADGQAWVQGPDRMYSPEELLALLLKKLVMFARIQNQEPITHGVLAVPAYFDEIQKSAVRRAAAMAGLEVLRTIPEPTAAALAYGLQRGGDRVILVYDFGGGTFDVSILRIRNGQFTTLAQSGDAALGGSNMDMMVAAHLAEQFQAEHGVDPRTNVYALHRLIIAAEQVKKDLSGNVEIATRVDSLMKLPNTFETPSFDVTMTREELEGLVGDLVERSFTPVRQALADAKLSPEQIDEVVLVGGQTRMPLVQRRVREFFGREPLRDIDPDQAVALGAAVFAATLSGDIKSISVNEIASMSIGVEVADGTVLQVIKRKDSLAKRRVKLFPLSDTGQTAAAIPIVQGDKVYASENRLLTTLVVENLSAQGVEVTLDYDMFGVLQIAARDAGGGPTISAGVHLATGLDEDAAAEVRRVADDEQGLAA